jgi:hypothetical protein
MSKRHRSFECSTSCHIVARTARGDRSAAASVWAPGIAQHSGIPISCPFRDASWRLVLTADPKIDNRDELIPDLDLARASPLTVADSSAGN